MAPLPRHIAPRIVAVLASAALVAAASACEEPGAAGSPTCRQGSPRLTVYQGPDGRCIPRTRVVGYRCEGADPLVVLDAGTPDERRFLGGRFTVPVPALPAGAEVLGVGDGAQLVAVPDEPRRLYTVRGSSIGRWLAVPDAGKVAQPPAAFMLGDSLLDGGAPGLLTALAEWTIQVDALNGRGAASGAAIAEARTTEDDVVLVELGTNDTSVEAFGASADRILQAFRAAPLVIWQNVEGPPDVVPADEINAEIERLAGRRPNVAIADWDDTVPEEYLFDGVHPDPDHQDAMAELIAPMLMTWLQAVTATPACD
jgi:hypothetical protein